MTKTPSLHSESAASLVHETLAQKAKGRTLHAQGEEEDDSSRELLFNQW
jgi:hypothetical protein